MINSNKFYVYTDGSCANTGSLSPGGWAAIIVDFNNNKQSIYGREISTTSDRMELTAIINALEFLPEQSNITLFTDSQTAVQRATKKGKSITNLDLCNQLDILCSKRIVKFVWIQGHVRIPLNEQADNLAWKQHKLAKIDAKNLRLGGVLQGK